MVKTVSPGDAAETLKPCVLLLRPRPSLCQERAAVGLVWLHWMLVDSISFTTTSEGVRDNWPLAPVGGGNSQSTLIESIIEGVKLTLQGKT